MSVSLTMLGLYKCAQISMPLLRAGGMMLRSAMSSGSEGGEWEKGVQEILGDQVKELLKGKIDKLSPRKLEAIEAPLVSFTGLVLQSLVQDVLDTDGFAAVKGPFNAALQQLPRHWKTFVAQGLTGAQPLTDKDFLAALQSAHEGEGTSPAVPAEWLAAFFSQWIRGEIGEVPFREGVHQKLATAVAPLIADGVSSSLAADHPVAAAAFRESMLHFHTELRSLVKEAIAEVKNQGAQSAERDGKMIEMVLELAANQRNNNKEERLAAYKRSLLAAFRPYQELAIDNFAAAEQAAPDIWDIFVHPACSTDHLRPEDMDAAQREMPPRLPAQDLLPLLAQEDHRRTVLLADPGMGKSTLIQSLIAHLASGRSFTGAAALTGLLPVPLILRDLVPLLPQDQVTSWTWDSLLTVLIETYQRDETAPPLCDGFKDHRDEFRQHLHTDAKVFFLIDGLDEIGDLAKRRQIVQCIQDGIRAAHKQARWLITSRVIGYDQASAHLVTERSQEPWMVGDIDSLIERGLLDRNDGTSLTPEARRIYSPLEEKWREFILPGEWFINEAKCSSIGLTLGAASKSSTIRTSGGHELSAQFLILECIHLAPFDDRRQDLFTQRWFQHRHSTDYSKELMREVRTHHHDGVRIISRVPNLLCMMNILKRSGKPLPDGRAALYDAIVQAYLGGIDSAYRLRPILGNTCPFDAPQRRFLLSLLGAHMQQTRTAESAPNQKAKKKKKSKDSTEDEGNILISRPELEKLLSPAIDSMRAAGKVQSTHTSAELLDELLHHIASRSGLLIPRSSDENGNTLYGFTHLSFLEFFAAEWLGLEFDRRQRQLARQSEALQDGHTLSNSELEELFPPAGPIKYNRADFPALAATPAWHEPLIFVLESRKADTSTLLRWLFPVLHSQQPQIVLKGDKNPTPLLSLDAVQLAVKLAQDSEIPLPTATRQQWWRTLWSAYLTWPFSPGMGEQAKRWAIAPLLLGGSTHRTEVLQALADVQPQFAGRPLYLSRCQLGNDDLAHVGSMAGLTHLNLSGCDALTNLDGLVKLKQLRELYLIKCTGLKGSDAFQHLAHLEELEVLWLAGNLGLVDTQAISGLSKLKSLHLQDCTSLQGREAFQGLTGLVNLVELDLSGCTGLADTQILEKCDQLEQLTLKDCTGLAEATAFQGISARKNLTRLDLRNCTGLLDTQAFEELKKLQVLFLDHCTGLQGRAALQGLAGLKQLKMLTWDGCTGITSEDVEWLEKKLGRQIQDMRARRKAATRSL